MFLPPVLCKHPAYEGGCQGGPPMTQACMNGKVNRLRGDCTCEGSTFKFQTGVVWPTIVATAANIRWGAPTHYQIRSSYSRILKYVYFKQSESAFQLPGSSLSNKCRHWRPLHENASSSQWRRVSGLNFQALLWEGRYLNDVLGGEVRAQHIL